MYKYIKNSIIFGICASKTIMALEYSDSTPYYYPGKALPEYYGNSQHDSFKQALTNSTPVKANEPRDIALLLPDKVSNSFYFRLGFNHGNHMLTKVTNKVAEHYPSYTDKLYQKSSKHKINRFEGAFGYYWKTMQIDLEFFSLSSLSYSSKFMKNNMDFTTTTQGNVFLINCAYLHFYKSVIFYINGALGLAENKTSTRLLINNEATNVKRYKLAYGLGIGGKVNLYGKWYLDILAKTIFLGKSVYEDNYLDGTQVIKLHGSRQYLGVAIRLQYLL